MARKTKIEEAKQLIGQKFAFFYLATCKKTPISDPDNGSFNFVILAENQNEATEFAKKMYPNFMLNVLSSTRRVTLL